MMMRIDGELMRELKSLNFFSRKSKSHCLSPCSYAVTGIRKPIDW